LITMYDQRNKISRMILEQIQSVQNPLFFRTIIQIDAKLKESPVYGKPITTYASKSRGAQQYRALAQELQSPEIEALLQKREAESSE
jgi:chromosome partitioning protein